MEFKTIEEWDEKLWKQAKVVYDQAFAGKGAKPEKVIRNMFQKGICQLHIAFIKDEAAAMALTGNGEGSCVLLIDYLAVLETCQQKGMGRDLVEYIAAWSLDGNKYDSMLIEVEAEDTPENNARIHFWEKCGFTITEYVHQYIWVPEPYRAMFRKLVTASELPESGEELFKYINQFHNLSFREK